MGHQAPTVTLLFTSFNQEKFVRKALESCFLQDYQDMEIFISDDCSTDSTFSIIKDLVSIYDGPCQVILNQNKTNMYLEHLDFILPRLRGELCVLACGDDIQYPNRVRQVVETWKSTNASVIGSAARIINDDGTSTETYQRAYRSPPDLSLQNFLKTGDSALNFGAALAWHRSIPETFGTFGPGVRNFDFLYPLRGIVLSGGAFIRNPLLDWRVHQGNTTLHDHIAHPITETDPEKRVERLKLRERKLLSFMSNWHRAIDDANIIQEKLQESEKANLIRNYAMTHIYNLMKLWRPIRHELINNKIE